MGFRFGEKMRTTSFALVLRLGLLVAVTEKSGLSLALCALAVNGLNYRLMDAIGADGVSAGFDRLLTALAAAGGSKSLHDLISRLQKAKEAAEEK